MNPSEMNMSRAAPLTAKVAPPIVSPANTWLPRLQTRLARLGAAWTARRRRSRELRELAAFSDLELRDLGLSRGDLPAITQGTFRR